MSFFRKPTPLPVQQGGTGDAYFSSGYALIGNGYSALLELTPSTSGNVMTSNGTTWTSAPPSGGGVTTFNAGTTGFTPSSATSGAITLAGTLATTNGGTGLTSFTTNGIPYATSTSALTTGSVLSFDGNKLATNALTFGYNTSYYNTDNSISNYSAGNYLYVSGNSTGGTGGLYLQGAGNQKQAIIIDGNSSGGNIAFQNNGSEKMRLNSSGQLLIATTTAPSSGSLLTINNANGIQYTSGSGGGVITPINTGGFQFFSYTGALGSETYAERARIDSSGRLLIGTTSATTNFNLVASQSADAPAGIMAENTSNTTSATAIVRFKNSGSTFAYIGLGSLTRASYATLGADVLSMYTGSTAGMSFSVDAVGSIKYATNSTLRMTIDASGNIGAPSGTNIYNASDARLKKNITSLPSALNKVNALKPVSFNWIDDFCKEENNKLMYGFIAQEVKEVDETLIENFSNSTLKVGEVDIENPLRVNEKFIIPMLTKAIQELSALVTAQSATITSLTERITALENK
jgi:hypothetical protein